MDFPALSHLLFNITANYFKLLQVPIYNEILELLLTQCYRIKKRKACFIWCLGKSSLGRSDCSYLLKDLKDINSKIRRKAGRNDRLTNSSDSRESEN